MKILVIKGSPHTKGSSNLLAGRQAGHLPQHAGIPALCGRLPPHGPGGRLERQTQNKKIICVGPETGACRKNTPVDILCKYVCRGILLSACKLYFPINVIISIYHLLFDKKSRIIKEIHLQDNFTLYTREEGRQAEGLLSGLQDRDEGDRVLRPDDLCPDRAGVRPGTL